MPMFIFDCPNCGNREKRLVNKKEVNCSKCDSLMEKNIIKSSEKQMFENVPGGFAHTQEMERRMSHDGQLQEAAFLAGESKNAY